MPLYLLCQNNQAYVPNCSMKNNHFDANVDLECSLNVQSIIVEIKKKGTRNDVNCYNDCIQKCKESKKDQQLKCRFSVKPPFGQIS